MPAADPDLRARIKDLNDRAPDKRGRYVLYWMQQSQRAQHNHALEHAITRANEVGLPLVVGFGLDYNQLYRNLRYIAALNPEASLSTQRRRDEK